MSPHLKNLILNAVPLNTQAIPYFTNIIIRRFVFIHIITWKPLLCKQDETFSDPWLSPKPLVTWSPVHIGSLCSDEVSSGIQTFPPDISPSISPRTFPPSAFPPPPRWSVTQYVVATVTTVNRTSIYRKHFFHQSNLHINKDCLSSIVRLG